jgi:predicted GIY-YIG superfamily endonuclease
MATISITWGPPLELHANHAQNMIYTCNLEGIPMVAGVYVFGRAFGDNFAPIYIGETENLQRRIAQHLQSVPLMMALHNAKAGTRFLHVGTLLGKRGQNEKSALQRVERAMIKFALAQGHELVNERGAKTPYDEIQFSGNRSCTRVFGGTMHLER